MPGPSPPVDVLRAFGVAQARPLPGGQGTSWLADGLVVKPVSGTVWEWLAPILLAASPEGIQLARPIPTRDGSWTYLGWSATEWLSGREADRSKLSTWIEIVEVGRALHQAVQRVPHHACLEARNDPWAVADRVAWGEQAPDHLNEFTEVVDRLTRAIAPLEPAQLVHGDLTGNVLFGPDGMRAVIDFSPYWRPPSYAEGIVIADALVWHGASVRLLDLAHVPMSAVARALLFRIGATSERVKAGDRGSDVADEARRYHRVSAMLGL